MNVRRQMLWILGWQLGFTLIFSGLAGLLGGKHALFSAFFGGGIAVCANAGYVWQSTRKTLKDGVKKVYRAQVLAEMLKCSLIVILFTMVFTKYREVSGLPLFIVYLSTSTVFWLALLRKV